MDRVCRVDRQRAGQRAGRRFPLLPTGTQDIDHACNTHCRGPPPPPGLSGGFVEDGGDTWYRIDGIESTPPFFVALAGDSDLWAFVSTAGSLTAGRRDQDGAFFPYETVDKLHRRWKHTGPRSWILVEEPGGPVLWEPFAPQLDGTAGHRSVWKNLSGKRLRFREVHPSGRLAFQHE